MGKAIGILLELVEQFVAWLKQKRVDSAMKDLKSAESEEERQNAAKSIADLISKR